ncbi:MAG: hypothetical protein Q9187_001976 [Circinaria calcarea]
MEDTNVTLEHRKKRRRRRRTDRAPLSAKLILENHGEGDVGLVSAELFAELFGCSVAHFQHGCTDGQAKHVAITPWRPHSPHLLEDASWVVIPVKSEDTPSGPAKASTAPSIRFPPSSLSIQGFIKNSQQRGGFAVAKLGFKILVLDTQPVTLDRIVVRVDGNALQKHEEIQRRFGGGFQSHGSVGKGKGKVNGKPSNESSGTDYEKEVSLSQDQQNRLRAAIRRSIASMRIIHQGDLLPLPLPAHPITHVAFLPVRVTMCEPVNQGFVSSTTRILIDVVSNGETMKYGTSLPKGSPSPGIPTEEAEDTSAEQFSSSLENGDPPQTKMQRQNLKKYSSSDSECSDTENSSLSDDLSDNLITLSPPSLPLSGPGATTTVTSATPRMVFGRNSGANTPGSVYSNFTSTTLRNDRKAPAKPFQAKALLRSVPDSVLFPQPKSDEDEEARVFIDVTMLSRLGCFSGDWVKVYASQNSRRSNDGYWGAKPFEDNGVEADEFRAVKLYSLADLTPKNNPDNPQRKATMRRSSTALSTRRPLPEAYFSPILLANLGNPSTVRLMPLLIESQDAKMPVKSKIDSVLGPPIAKEITLLRLATPLSTEKAMQPGILASLKRHFERRRRILRKGDLVSISMDIDVSKILSEGSSEVADEIEELLISPTMGNQLEEGKTGVAWFKVGQVTRSSDDENRPKETDTWGVASIEPKTTRMVQVGTEQSKVPSSIGNPWEYYLGLRRPPRLSILTNPAVHHSASIDRLHITPLRRRIRELLAAATAAGTLHLDLKPIVILLHSTQRRIGKAHLASRACADLGLHVFPIDAYDILTEGGAGGGDVKTEASLKAKVDRVMSCGPEFTVPLIRHLEALTADRMGSVLKDVVEDVKAIIMTTTDIDKVPEDIRSLFTHELEVSAPDEGEREGILEEVIQAQGVRLAFDVDLSAIAVKTAAFVAGDLVDVVERARIARQERLEALGSENSKNAEHSGALLLRDLLVSGGATCTVTKADFDLAVEAARKNFADAIGAPKIPNVSWDDVGGLTNVKDAVMETIQLPLERPELFAKGMKKRSGILFYGPPGTGKTLLAKAIATEFSLNFFSVKGPELLNMYIGESEANVRRVFQRARDARPCVVFFDELDSVAPKRGNQGDSGGVMDRIVSQLLAELDGMSNGDEAGGGVFVIGATNRPDLLDQALLRPGRFDKMLYLGVSDTHDKQLTILEALTRKFTLHPKLSLRLVAESLPFTYTGADLYALCSDAMLKAITRQASAVDAKIKAMPVPVTAAYFFDHYAIKEDIAVVVTEEDFYAAQQELIGSVSAKELEHYQRVRKAFEGPTLNSSSTGGNLPPQLDLPYPKVNGTGQAVYSRSKPKPRYNTKAINKGKGTAIATNWSSEHDYEDGEDDDDDEAYVTSNDYGTPARYASSNVSAKGKGKSIARDYQSGDDGDGDVFTNGSSKGKGKGKAVVREPSSDGDDGDFGDTGGDDEEELYG